MFRFASQVNLIGLLSSQSQLLQTAVLLTLYFTCQFYRKSPSDANLTTFQIARATNLATLTFNLETV